MDPRAVAESTIVILRPFPSGNFLGSLKTKGHPDLCGKFAGDMS